MGNERLTMGKRKEKSELSGSVSGLGDYQHVAPLWYIS